jgi:hypothetical protein
MPSAYYQEKRIYLQLEKNNPEKEKENNLRGMKTYYEKHRENINIKNLARYRLGTSFYSLCVIYTNLYE